MIQTNASDSIATAESGADFRHLEKALSLPADARGDGEHLPFLDGLRALAILWVIGFHSLGPIAGFLAHGGGWAGVDVFFVISGFLITGILLKEKKKTSSISLKNFYIRRMLRLLPAYYTLLAVVFFVNPFHNPNITAAVGIALIYLSNYDLGLGWGRVIHSGLEISWSLAVEEQFYFVWPSAVTFLRRHLWQVAVTVIAACEAWKIHLITDGAPWMRICCGFDTRIDILMLGCLAAIALNNERSRSWLEKLFSNSWVAPATLITLIYYVRGIGHPQGAVTIATQLNYWELRMPVLAILTTVLILSLCLSPRSAAARFLSLPVFTFIGRISYSLYLWHILALVIVINWLGALGVWHRELVGYAVAIALASASYYLIERPFLRLKEKFSRSSSSLVQAKKPGRVRQTLTLVSSPAYILEDGSLLP